MILQSIEYSQFDDTPRQWKLENCTFGKVNLLVGENATGKSKTLNIIKVLANLIAGDIKLTFMNGNYTVSFENDKKPEKYHLKYVDSLVVEEQLDIGTKHMLSRGEGGKGKIHFEILKQKVDFQTPQNELAVFARRDSLQHPFLDRLYQWGKAARHYYFGSLLGKDHLAIFQKAEEKQEINFKDTNSVVGIFKKGDQERPSEFKKIIMDDMKFIGYDLDDIFLTRPRSFVIIGAPGEVNCLGVKEKDLNDITDQQDMSQGMFRCLSLLIQINYALISGVPSCILIDDIGEGLDYERSSSLVKLLLEKAKAKSVQLIMATNDRFVMNSVPLEYWSIVRRIGGITQVYNYRNCPDLFKEFQLTGLSNFDLFSTKFYLKDNGRN